MLRKILSGLCLGVFAFAVSASAGTAINTACPISGKDVADGPTATHNKATIGFCCGKCKGKFEANPDGVFSKVKMVPVNTNCPISGKKAKASQVALSSDGEPVATCCGNCLKKFKADPASFAAKIKKDAR